MLPILTFQTVQIPAYGKTFTFEIPYDNPEVDNNYEPHLDDEMQECVLVMANGDIYQPL